MKLTTMFLTACVAAGLLVAPAGVASAALIEMDIVAGDAAHVRSGNLNYNNEQDQPNNVRMMVGYHSAGTVQNVRGFALFDLSDLQAVQNLDIQSVTLSLTIYGIGHYDQEDGYFDIELKNHGEQFDASTVTWASLNPSGGDVSGAVLSTLDAYPTVENPGTAPSNPLDIIGEKRTFDSTPLFVSTVQGAVSGDGWLSLVLYSPGAEAKGGDHDALYSFNVDDVTLSVSYIPEPATMTLLGLGGLMALARRRRR